MSERPRSQREPAQSCGGPAVVDSSYSARSVPGGILPMPKHFLTSRAWNRLLARPKRLLKLRLRFGYVLLCLRSETTVGKFLQELLALDDELLELLC